jgi:hypothetical protein
MYNISCMKKDEELEYFMLMPTYNKFWDEGHSYVFIMTKGTRRKPVIINYPRFKFDRKLRYFNKLYWN